MCFITITLKLSVSSHKEKRNDKNDECLLIEQYLQNAATTCTSTQVPKITKAAQIKKAAYLW